MAKTSPDSRGSGSNTDAGFDPDATGLGELLKRARERCGVTIAQVSDETKIPRRHLEALERNDFSGLPAGFYQRAEVRAYARAINLDQDLAVAKLDAAFKPSTKRGARSIDGASKMATVGQWVLIVFGAMVAAGLLARSIRPNVAGSVAATPPGAAIDAGRPQNGGAGELRPAAVPVEPSTGAAPANSTVTDDSPARTADTPVATVAAPSPVRTTAGPATETPLSSDLAAPEAASPSPVAELRSATGQPTSGPPREPGTVLVLTTVPAGARVTVDGIGWGVAPITIRFLPSGEKRIRVSKEGFETEERTVHVSDGRPAAITIQLRPVQ